MKTPRRIIHMLLQCMFLDVRPGRHWWMTHTFGPRSRGQMWDWDCRHFPVSAHVGIRLTIDLRLIDFRSAVSLPRLLGSTVASTAFIIASIRIATRAAESILSRSMPL